MLLLKLLSAAEAVEVASAVEAAAPTATEE
jgi:hypothetical protein